MEIINVQDFLCYYMKVKGCIIWFFLYIFVDKIEWIYQKGKFIIGDLIWYLVNIECYMYVEMVQFKFSMYQGCDIFYVNGYDDMIVYYYQMYEEFVVVFL